MHESEMKNSWLDMNNMKNWKLRREIWQEFFIFGTKNMIFFIFRMNSHEKMSSEWDGVKDELGAAWETWEQKVAWIGMIHELSWDMDPHDMN